MKKAAITLIISCCIINGLYAQRVATTTIRKEPEQKEPVKINTPGNLNNGDVNSPAEQIVTLQKAVNDLSATVNLLKQRIQALEAAKLPGGEKTLMRITANNSNMFHLVANALSNMANGTTNGQVGNMVSGVNSTNSQVVNMANAVNGNNSNGQIANMAAASNVASLINAIRINSPLSDNNPNAVIYITPVTTTVGYDAILVHNQGVVSAFYNITDGFWYVTQYPYAATGKPGNETKTANFQAGDSFNVLISK